MPKNSARNTGRRVRPSTKAVEKLEAAPGTGLANRLDALLDFEKIEEEPDPRAVKAVAKLKPEAQAEGDEKTPARMATGRPPVRRRCRRPSLPFSSWLRWPERSIIANRVKPLRWERTATPAPMCSARRGATLLKRDLPTGGDESERRETYLAGGSSQRGFLLAPALGAAGSSWNAGTIPDDLCHPFDSSLRRSYLEPEKPADPVKWTDENDTTGDEGVLRISLLRGGE